MALQPCGALRTGPPFPFRFCVGDVGRHRHALALWHSQVRDLFFCGPCHSSFVRQLALIPTSSRCGEPMWSSHHAFCDSHCRLGDVFSARVEWRTTASSAQRKTLLLPIYSENSQLFALMPHRTPLLDQGFAPPPSKPFNTFARTQTPKNRRSGGFPDSKASPLTTPNRVVFPDGSPMLLYTPEQIKNGEHRPPAPSQAPSPRPSMGPPSQSSVAGRTETPTRRRPIVFPRNLRPRKTSSSRPAASNNTGSSTVRRALDPTCPTVQLLRVLNKCWDLDMQLQVEWTVRDARLNGRAEQRDRSRMWDLLGTTVNNVWPNIRGWIMSHTPFDHDVEWFTWEDGINSTNEDCISDPHIATKPSSFERMGFCSTCLSLFPS